METKNTIKCPYCNKNLETSIVSEFETSIRKDLDAEYNERLTDLRISIRNEIYREAFMKTKEREGVIIDLKQKIEEMKRKLEQGSMQAQGEAQEQALEALLKELHPTDEILEVKKGQCGADLIHVVKTQSGHEIGKILYESKNTQAFSEGWISKMKSDNLNSKCDILIIVTKTMPKDIKGNFGVKDGVWICTYNAVKDLTLVLRFGLLKMQSVLIKQEGKQAKSELLYEYLTSEQFKNLYESILTSFQKLEDTYSSEQTKLKKLWAERTKILQLSKANAIEMYGTIKGIAGSAIPEIEMLELKQAS